ICPALIPVDCLCIGGLTYERENRDGWQAVGNFADNVGMWRIFGQHVLDGSFDVVTDHRFKHFETTRCECLLRDSSDPCVLRRTTGRQSGINGEATIIHDLSSLWSTRANGCLRVLRGERLPVIEDSFDVVIGRNYVQIGAVIKHDRLFMTQLRVCRKWVVLIERLVAMVIGWCTGVVCDGATADGLCARHRTISFAVSDV